MGKEFKQRNRTTYVRSPNDGDMNKYSKIDSDLIEDSRLSIFQVGLMTYILNQSNDFIINKGVIQKRSGLGRLVFDREWAKLIEFGYLEMLRFKGGVEWIIHENPTMSNSNCS